MACVILPSETARLVYGYLVKENMTEIALQFLESSPYLMDCCQIVKSGYQFNTKLMGKDLPELLQEYSVIHNLVNKKISGLCKSSLLYKRIKLRCESLPEIVELILFWRYNKPKINNETVTNSDKCEKKPNSEERLSNSDYCNFSDVSQVEYNEKTSDNNSVNKNGNSIQKDNSGIENYHSSVNSENYLMERNEDVVNQNQKEEIHLLNTKKSSPYVSLQTHEVAESIENKTNSMCSKSNLTSSKDTDKDNNNSGVNNLNCLSDSKFSNSTNILTMDVDSECRNLVNGEMQSNSLVPNERPVSYENAVRIVGIQENQTETHSLEVYSKSLPEGQVEDESMNLQNSSVLFVNPDVGNVISQEQSQIIVIPFDYYKSQNGLQNDLGIENKTLGLMSNELVSQSKNDIIFDAETTSVPSFSSSSMPPLFSDRNTKSPAVDENIVTENDFLKNGQLIYNLEKEFYKPDPPPQSQVSKETNKEVTVQAVSTPLIVVSQPVPAKPPRYRAILPKKKKPVQMHPVVVVHPLLENNKDLTKMVSSEYTSVKAKNEGNRRVKRKRGLHNKTETKEISKEEKFKEPLEKAAIELRNASESETDNSNVRISSGKEVDIEKKNEEKENLEKSENKKNETPVFFTKRNSKRLSLSTPRRRSHIRALEFETPPKTNDNKKKSRTSPKLRVEQVKVERKSVRNTLFKSPIYEDSSKLSAPPKESEKPEIKTSESFKLLESNDSRPLNELSIPIATRSPNTKLSDAWENLTGVGCVIGQNNISKISPTKKMWDADLRCFILESSPEDDASEKKKMRKPEKCQKDNRKSTKKKAAPPKRIKPTPVTVSPSKMSLTAKRNTYFINGNEDGSPIRSLIDDLKLVTPFKDIDSIRSTEETPLTKLLRENINTIDIDLSMINTPSFPPTPSIVITPDLDDVSINGTNYYSPSKDCSKDKLLKITDYFKPDSEKVKKETKEMHEKVIDDLVSKAKEIIGLGKEIQEENISKKRPSGKILSMVKIQMLSQCDKKLMENIPINEETSFASQMSNQTIIGNVMEETGSKIDLKEELEEKRKRALKKIKVVKENLSQAKNRISKRGRKRKRSGNATKSDKSRSDISKESVEDNQVFPGLDDSAIKEPELYHSTPNGKRDLNKSGEKSSDKKENDEFLEDIRKQFPPFSNDTGKYPELNEKSRKKLHFVESFLELSEISKYLNEFSISNAPKLFLKPSLRRFFHVFYKWLKHPHKRELNASSETNAALKKYLSLFDKLNLGLNRKNKKGKKSETTPNLSEISSSDNLENESGSKIFQSDDECRESKSRACEKRKEEEVEDGIVSTLPLKKRKSTVQQVEIKTSYKVEKNDGKENNAENVSQTQNFLQDIDVDRFLSQIHGQEGR